MDTTEKLRKQLNELINLNNGKLVAEEVVKLSQELDELIVIEQRKRMS